MVATLRIVSTDAASQGPFVVINAEDFDQAVHKLYGEEEVCGADEPAQEPQSDAAPKRRGRQSKTLTE